MNTVRIFLSSLDLTRTRFAFSPLWETVMGYRVMRDPSHFAVHLPWVCEAREATQGLDLSPLEALVRPKGYLPDFLTPPPSSALPDFAQELSTLRNTPLETVRREVALTYPNPKAMPEAARAFLDDTAQALEGLADAAQHFWECALEAHWPRLRAMLESDVLSRARHLALGGFEALFADLNPLVRYREGFLELDGSLCAESFPEVVPAGRGLLLMPSAFVWPRFNTILDPAWQTTLAYTPRGVANLWNPQPPPVGQALELLLGKSRAEVLLSLDPPSSTLELAHRLHLAPGGVSEHLTLLRQAGLVETHRRGRFVLYRLSPTGCALLELLGAPSESTPENKLEHALERKLEHKLTLTP